MKIKFLFFKFCTLMMIVALLCSTSAFAASGILDATFGINGIVHADLNSNSDSGNDVIVQTDGKIIVMASAQLDAANQYHRTPILIRYNMDGSVDSAFGNNGRVIAETDSFAGSRIALQPDGKIIAAGSHGSAITVVRYNTSGVLDTSFGTNGVASLIFTDALLRCTDAAVQTNGKIIIAGYEEIGNYVFFIIARFNTNGTRDDTFGDTGIIIPYFPNSRYNYGEAVVIQPDGKIVMSGSLMPYDAPDNNYALRISLVRFNSNGSLDNTFGSGGMVVTNFPRVQNNRDALSLQSDGRILVAGVTFNATEDLAVARFNSNGSLDSTFGGNGIMTSDFGGDENGFDVFPQTGGKILVTGNSSSSTFSDFFLVRYNSNGSIDSTFGENGQVRTDLGSVDSGQSAAMQSDGKILITGSSDGDAVLLRYDVSTPAGKIFKSAGVYDGWILESTETSNMGGSLNSSATTFNLGDDLKDRQYRSILSFNTTSIPDTAVITSAKIKIKRQGLIGTNPFTTHGDLYLNISNRAFNYNLALQLNDFETTVMTGATQDKITAETFNWYAAELSPANLGFINKTGITQFRLRFSKDDNDDLSADYMKFFSGNSVDANKPQLIISYYIP